MDVPETALAAKTIVAELQNIPVGYTPGNRSTASTAKLKIEVNRRGLYVRHRGWLPCDAGRPPAHSSTDKLLR